MSINYGSCSNLAMHRCIVPLLELNNGVVLANMSLSTVATQFAADKLSCYCGKRHFISHRIMVSDWTLFKLYFYNY